MTTKYFKHNNKFKMNFIEQLNQDYKIILASASPRRSHLLTSIGLQFEVMPSDIVEPDFDLSPTKYCTKNAILKAEAVLQKVDSTTPTLIISADTIVVLKNTIINKPTDEEDAFRTLKKLSNRIHVVYTGVCVINTSNNKKLSK